MKSIALPLLLLAAIWQMSCYHIMDGLVPVLVPVGNITLDTIFDDWNDVPVFSENTSVGYIKLATNQTRDRLFLYIKRDSLDDRHIYLAPSLNDCITSGSIVPGTLIKSCDGSSIIINYAGWDGPGFQAEAEITSSMFNAMDINNRAVIWFTKVVTGPPDLIVDSTEPRMIRIRNDF